MNNDSKKDSTISSHQLDALVILLCEILKQVSKDKDSVQEVKEKAAVVLVAGGISKERAAKLVGTQKKKVVRATKTIKL